MIKTIIEAQPGEHIRQFYDHMLEYVNRRGTDVYGVFNDQLFKAYAYSKKYSDIVCYSGRYNPNDEDEKRVSNLE